MTHFAGLSKTAQARLQKLADAAGRTPHDMLKYVLRDGFEQTEQEVRLIKKRMVEAATCPAVPHEQAMERIERALDKYVDPRNLR
ncbi:MAG: hypothetical protein WC091_16775 [Sulfuricellaceae bacterium]